MRGLLLHDLAVMKRQGRTYLVFLLFFFFLGFVSGNIEFFGSFLMIYSVSFGTAVFSYHEQCNWDTYANTLPVSRKQIVGSFYLLNGLFLLTGGCIGLAANLFLVLKGEMLLAEGLVMTGAVFTVGILMSALDIPLLLKFGSERGRMIMMSGYAVVFIVFIAAGKWLAGREFSLSGVTDGDVYRFAGAALAAAAVLLFFSYRCSFGIYRKKEF